MEVSVQTRSNVSGKKKKSGLGEIKLRIIGFIKVKFIFYVIMQYNSEHNQFLLTGA